MSRSRLWILFSLTLVLIAGFTAARLSARAGAPPPNDPLDAHHAFIAAQPAPAPRTLWPVSTSVPEGPPRIPTDEFDHLGRPVTVSCASCHANIEPNFERTSAEHPPMQFHQGLIFEHGMLACVSCHNPHDANTLRLADGRAVPYPDVMTMCAQCHAPQARDYEHGAHGGMTGYWDRTRGPRERKSCIDCHDPHAPKFPSMTPTFKPIDRFLPTDPHHTESAHD